MDRYVLTYADEVRAVETRHLNTHHAMVEWGVWARHWKSDADFPSLKAAGIWRLPGDYDPDMDPDAVPESPPPPINQKRVAVLDTVIHKADFPALWRKIIKANYVFTIPEHQRPREAKCSESLYIESLSNLLFRLSKSIG